MPAHQSIKPILYALSANAAIAACKFGAALYTASGAMLAESIHSLADCMNQILLMAGLRQARKQPTELHPLGTSRVTYFYSMIVALLLFFVGGAFSVYEGVHRIMHPEVLSRPYVALGILVVSAVLEGLSLAGALREIRVHAQDKSFWRWFRETRESELLIVAGEDVAALAGLAIAMAAIAATMITGNPLYDACGSVAIGVLLMTVAALVLREVKSMIVGESASPEQRRAIAAHLKTQPEIIGLISLITLQWGHHIVVAAQAEMIDFASGRAQIDAINRIEESLQRAFPSVKWVFFEPDVPRAAREA